MLQIRRPTEKAENPEEGCDSFLTSNETPFWVLKRVLDHVESRGEDAATALAALRGIRAGAGEFGKEDICGPSVLREADFSTGAERSKVVGF